ncbi:MAG: hypothetical protein ACREP7_21550 [Lysobacter sp.]
MTLSIIRDTASTLQALPVPLEQIRFAYTTRRMRHADIAGVIHDQRAPRSGDLVLAVIESIGQHRQIEFPSGRKARLYVGDHVVLAYGNRYAPDQFEALVPDNLGPCHLINSGGMAAREIARHAKMAPATDIRPLGLLADASGRPLNLADYALPRVPMPLPGRRPLVFFVCGTSMNSGKTYTAHELVRGLRSLGLEVGAAKVTGTGAGHDPWRLADCGAKPVYDFTDAGHPSTYCLPMADIEDAMDRVLAHLSTESINAIVVEVADGIGQAETATLLQSPRLSRWCDGVLFAAADPLAAQAGVEWLRACELPVLAASGLMTAVPLVQEEAQSLIDVPVLSAEQLAGGHAFVDALHRMGAHLPRRLMSAA